jgi:hypothetical protein
VQTTTHTHKNRCLRRVYRLRSKTNTDVPESAACCSWSWPWLRLKMTPFGRADVGAAAYTIPWDVWYIIPGYGGVIILAAHTHFWVNRLWRKRPWPTFGHYSISLKILTKTTKNSEYSFWDVRFEPGTFRIRSRDANHMTTTLSTSVSVYKFEPGTFWIRRSAKHSTVTFQISVRKARIRAKI